MDEREYGPPMPDPNSIPFGIDSTFGVGDGTEEQFEVDESEDFTTGENASHTANDDVRSGQNQRH